MLIPYARGYGETRFLSAKTLRNGQPAALAEDLVAFMDALGIERAVLGGYDWGARTADIVAALWPQRVNLRNTPRSDQASTDLLLTR
ncbi:alpha/beta hydrolase fold [Pseudomonas japonica]|uniref:Alpha/beta hydrolase fold n=1 Tax=Pseudomonas japonica TaxID=256466 RepID=A0A239LER1_9PSED|nr:alpha/beta hydrolase fold [Pseudomonas japonica]